MAASYERTDTGGAASGPALFDIPKRNLDRLPSIRSPAPIDRRFRHPRAANPGADRGANREPSSGHANAGPIRVRR